MNSTHRAEVVPVTLEKHTDADNLSVCRVWGYTCVVRTNDWQGISKAIYIPPDTEVSTTRSEFSFLSNQAKSDGYYRVRARRFRGVLSFGLLIPAPPDAQIGDDYFERLGCRHYDPAEASQQKVKGFSLPSGEVAPAPPGVVSYKYDLESGRRYHQLIPEGTPCVVSEKIDGESSRYCFVDGQMHCSSHYEWKRQYATKPKFDLAELTLKVGDEERARGIIAKIEQKFAQPSESKWWAVLRTVPQIEQFCRANPRYVLYGELFGSNSRTKYGARSGQLFFAAFDVLRSDGTWMPPLERIDLLRKYDVPQVPILDLQFAFNHDTVCDMAERQSVLYNGKAEGVVVEPVTPIYDIKVGYVKLKYVSGDWLAKAA